MLIGGLLPPSSAHLKVPPPYRPEPGQPLYEIRVGERVAQVAEGNLAGVLRELVTAVLAEGGDDSGSGMRKPGQRVTGLRPFGSQRNGRNV
jgi:hypothetical protein